MPEAKQVMRDCPFYGTAMAFLQVHHDPPFRLMLMTESNRCSLITQAHSPCMLEQEGKSVDWSTCPRVKEIVL